MKKILLFAMLLMVFGGVSIASAETAVTISASNQAQIDAINSLTAQIKALQEERKTKLSTLITQLKQGSTGDAVTTLQTLLALDPSIYPEGIVSGYFGKLTAKAVKEFQKKNGLEQVGNVGPKTLEKLKKLAEDRGLTAEDGENSGKGKKLCAMIPPGHLIAKGWLKRNDGKAPVIPNCQIIPKGIQDKLNDSDNDDDSDDEDDEDDNDNDDDEDDTTAPTISAVEVKDITTTSARVKWNTNDDAKSKIWYSTVNPVNMATASTVQNSFYVESHSMKLTSLSPDTTYYFIVGGADESGNTSTSSQGSFKTLAGDTTGPVISELGATDVDDTEVEITWKTSEDTKAKIWYSTVNPVVTSGTPQMTHNDFANSHKFEISGLATSTTYYYIVSSTDASGNTTMSEQKSFTTDAD